VVERLVGLLVVLWVVDVHVAEDRRLAVQQLAEAVALLEAEGLAALRARGETGGVGARLIRGQLRLDPSQDDLVLAPLELCGERFLPVGVQRRLDISA
jgi:hypothetical protein